MIAFVRARVLPLLLFSAAIVIAGIADAQAPKPAPAPAPEQPTPAPEQPDAAPEPVEKEISPEKKADARVHYKKGRALMEQNSYAPALAEFLKSLELYPNPGATVSAAYSLFKLQRFDDSLDYYEAFLRDYPDAPTAEERATVQKQITDLRGMVGTIDIMGGEPGASIVVSGTNRGEYPLVKPLRVREGTHVVRVFKQGYEPFQTEVHVAGGELKTVQAKLVRLTSSGKLRVTERSGKVVDVIVDGVPVGKSPWQGVLSVGDHSVALKGAGKIASQPATATIKPEELTPLALLAEELDAQLQVEPKPAGADVLIDGVNVGSGVWLGRLKPGKHKVVGQADGFLDLEQEVTLSKGEREIVALELERDDEAPMWRKPARWAFSVDGGLVVVPSLGGDIADQCEGDCNKSIGLGGLARVTGAYELGSGLGFGIELGYMVTAQTVEGRSAEVQPHGVSTANSGTATDDLRVQGLLAGAGLHYHLGEDYPVVLRLSGGILYGEIRDERIGDFTARDGGSYGTFTVVDYPTITYFYIDPGIRAGVRFSDHWELSASVHALMMIALSQPKFDDTIQVAASTDGIGNYKDESVMGSFVIGVVPGANLRYDFQ